MDVVASVSGGMRLRDPGADLAVLAALASAATDRALPRGTGFLGEVALSGAIRPVHQAQRRLGELARAGFRRCVVPAGTQGVEGLELVPVRNVREALVSVFREPALSHSQSDAR
jgi:DNA repair protein RadA/Sms